MGGATRLMNRQKGFTLIELLMAMALSGILMTLAAGSLRHYWFVRALESGRQEVESQLRRQQQRVVAETHPLVYGLRFPRRDGGSTPLNSVGLVRFNGRSPATTADDTCALERVIKLPTGVEVGTVVTGYGDPYVTDFCKAQIRDALDQPSNDHFVFFFARGNSNSAEITLIQTKLDNRPNKLCVSPIVARVYKVDAGDPCFDE